MPRKTESKTIDGLRVETTQYAAVRAYRLWARLLPLAASALPRLALKSLRAADLADTELAYFAPALAAIASQLTADSAESLMLDVLAGTNVTFTRGGKPAQVTLDSTAAIDEAFDGNVGGLLKAMAHALRVNFAGFGIGASGQSGPAAPGAADAA